MNALVVKYMKRVFPQFFVKRRYKKIFGKELDLNNPEGFNEKILWLIFNWQHPLLVQCADKVGLRSYVKSCELDDKELLPNTLGVWDDAKNIPWSELPNKFAIKCNHGAKWNIICTDKSKLDINEATDKLNMWLKIDYGTKEAYQPHYSKIKPQIIAEEYIEPNKNKQLPDDYKIYCFNGKPTLVLVCLEREEQLELEWYDLDWNVLDIGAVKNKKKAIRPKALDEMVRYAQVLAKPFPYVRVDFYECKGKPILGELTFTPYFGMAEYYSAEGNRWLGGLLELPEKYPKHFE